MSKCPLIAKAIVYAARQAQLINQYGMTWDAIEVNTANILAGCSVPADGKMNSAEAVQATIMERLRVQADTGRYTGPLVEPISPGSVEERVALELVDKYHRTKQCLANVREQRNQLNKTVDRLTDERDNALEAMRIEATAAQQARQELVQLRNSMIPHPDHSRLAELEARNVELRQMLERSQQDREMDVIQLTRDRDGFRNGAQFWMDSAKAACARVVKLRTFLEGISYRMSGGNLTDINILLEQTK